MMMFTNHESWIARCSQSSVVSLFQTYGHMTMKVTVVIVSIFLFNYSKHSQIELSECEATLDLAKSLMFERILLLLCPALRWPPSDYSRLRCIFLDGKYGWNVLRNFCFIIAAYVQDVWAPWTVGYRNQLVKSCLLKWLSLHREEEREDNLTDWVGHTSQRVNPGVLITQYIK